MATNDAVTTLLERRTAQHHTARRALELLQREPGIFQEYINQVAWLRHKGRPADTEILTSFLRKKTGVVNQNLATIFSRLAVILYPTFDRHGLFKMIQCEEDAIFGTKVVTRRWEKKGNRLQISRALRIEVSQLAPPPPPQISPARSTRRRTLKPEEMSWVVPFVEDVIARSDNSLEPSLIALREHVAAQPEILALADKHLRASSRAKCSALDSLIYAVRAAKRTGQKFTKPGHLKGHYCRILARRNSKRYNGWIKFNSDRKGAQRESRVNEVLGTYLAPKPVNGERYRRLYWHRDTVTR
ncbi:MAG: hypothetical protein ABSB87_13280 [Terriglobales bacterium]|jgi:hypothetical protein